MPKFPATRPVVIGRPAWLAELAIPAAAQRLALIVHADAAGPHEPGQGFIADVLRANGMATLSFGLRAAGDEAHPAAVPDAEAFAARLADALAWLAQHGQTRGLRVGLLAMGEAVNGCVAAARRPGLAAIEALVLVGGRPDLALEAVARWSQPTLLIADQNLARRKGRGPTGARRLRSPHRLVRLALETQGPAHAGVHEAIACAATAWLHHAIPAGAAAPAPPLAQEAAHGPIETLRTAAGQDGVATRRMHRRRSRAGAPAASRLPVGIA